MELVDANIVLRYLINDIKEQALKSKEILENKDVTIPFEVIAEVVYVLNNVYNITKVEIQKGILKLFEFSNIRTSDFQVLCEALNVFQERNVDFVDAILFGYSKVRNLTVHTYDKKLRKLLNG